MTDRKIIRLYNKVTSVSIELSNVLQDLANAASERLGYDIVADLCNGGEIEFRRIMDDGVPDTDSCIYLEDILAENGE